MPESLDESFVIILDDAGRYGEVTAMAKLLQSSRIPYLNFDINGITRQYVFCSKDLEWLQYT